MSVITKNYGLTAFIYGEPYSAFADQRRFRIIDTQLAFISDLIGDGVIDGWTIIDQGSGSPSIYPVASCSGTGIRAIEGSGLINRKYTRTFGTIDLSTISEFPSYIYMTRKDDFTYPFSGFSLGSITASDTIAPDATTGLAVTDTTYNSISLSWNTNTEEDMDGYIIQRSSDGIIYSDLDTTTGHSHTDEDLEENTIYYYRVIAYDLSGNNSVPSAVITSTTLLNLTAPENPENIIKFVGDSFIQLAWTAPKNNNISHYLINIYYLDEEQSSENFVDSLTTADNNIIISELIVGRIYKVYLYTISDNGVASSGSYITTSLILNPGPNEIYNLGIIDSQSSDNPTGINLRVSWSWNISAYFPVATKFMVYVVENSNFVSDPIEVFNNMTSSSFSVDIENYISNGAYRKILPDKYYIIQVKAVDEFGNINAGIIKDITTSRYISPASPSNINITLKNDKDLLFTWKNSINAFSYNIITVTKTDLSTLIVANITTDENIGTDTSYIIDNPLDFYSEYKLYIKCYDSVSNQYSQEINETYSTGVEPTIKPDIPKLQFALNGDREVFLGWQDAIPNTSKYFKVWRAIYKNSSAYSSSDFSLIDTIDKSNSSYVDHTVINDIKYIYFITTVDIYENESLNPVDDGFITYELIMATPHDNGFDEVSALTVDQIGDFNTLISWDAALDTFDGWEIYRSINNKYSWEKIGSVGYGVFEYLDTDSLLVDGYTYFYMVRKYKNEAEITISTSTETPDNSILLAKISCEDGVLDITDLSTNIKDVADVVQSFMSEALSKQHHLLNTYSDKRVDLIENVILSDWTTSDNKTYTTTQDFSGTSFVAYVDSVATNIFYEVSPTNKKIVFESETNSQDVTLECIGLQETSGVFKENRLQNELYAALVDSGKLLRQQLPVIAHDNRKDESLIPLQIPLITQDGYNFSSFQTTGENFGNCLTFYDITNTTAYSSELLAATSKGIFISSDTGSSWTLIYSPDGVVHKLFKSNSLSSYLALGNNAAYYSTDGQSWAKISGLENTNAVRGACDDGINIYLTTDSGIYRLDIDTISASNISYVSPAVSNCYGIYFNSASSEFILSTDLGLFSSIDAISWTSIDSTLAQCPIYDFIEESSYIFAVSNCGIYRTQTSSVEFELSAYINADYVNKIAIFNYDGVDRLVILSNAGVLFSTPDEDIYTDDILTFSNKLVGINGNGSNYDITSLNIINNAIFSGTDGKLFMASSENSNRAIYDETGSEGFFAPTIFVNNQKMSINVFLDLPNNTVYFIDRVSDVSTVSVANQYKIFKSLNGGWINEKYDASINIKVNGELTSVIDAIMLSEVTSAWGDVSFPTMTEYIANVTRANEYIQDFNSNIASLSLEDTPLKDKVVRDIWNNYDQICKQFIAPVKFYSPITINSSNYYIFGFLRVLENQSSEFYGGFTLVPSLPEVLATNINFEMIDGSNGLFVFNSSLGKYDNPTVTISSSLISFGEYGHGYLEDSVFENINSGLPASLALTQQSNLASSISFVQENIGDINNSDGSRPLSRLVGADRVFLTEYDTFNSTVDYIEELTSDEVETIQYITCVGYFNSTVLLGSYSQGLWTLDPSTLEIDKIDLFSYNNIENIISIQVNDGKIYILTDYKVFWSEDLITWNQLTMKDMGYKNLALLANGDIILLASEAGLYKLNNNLENWSLISSDYTSISDMFIIDYIYYIINDNKIYFSINTLSWSAGGDFGNVFVNNFAKYLSLIAIGTSSGLRYSNSTFTTGDAQLSLVDILNDISLSSALKINFVLAHNDDFIAFSSEGKSYTTNDGATFTEVDLEVPAIKFAIFIDDILWTFNYNSVKIGSIDPIRISKGIGL